MKKKIKLQIVKTKFWFEKNEKYLSVIFFTSGLILDNLTLTRIDLLYDNVVILSYLILAILSIILINYSHSTEKQKKFYKYLPLATQFFFGGLFSAYIIFYTKSASWTSSWVFLLIIYAIFIGNEKFRKKYKKIDFQINILFVAIFSFFIFFIPVVTKKIGTNIFIISGLFSLVLISLLISFLSKYILRIELKRKNKIKRNIIFIYLVFNFMYFANIIPPIPLSLKDIGVYHSIQRTADGSYLVEKEQYAWYDFYNKWNKKFTKEPFESVYVYSSVFAPTDLNTTAIHIWQKFNENTKRWEVVNKIEYPIKGGRSRGYRAYSFMENATKGSWRVDVTTKRGQVIGRIRFDIIESDFLNRKKIIKKII